MQIIQTIRDKGAAIIIAVIALSLIGFILMDANQGGNMFSSFSTSVGEVNGESIELNDFNQRVVQATMMEERSGQKVTGVRSYQLRDQMWNQVVAEKIFFAETKKLGIELTSKELSAILLSNDPSNPFMQEQGLLNEQGQLDIAKAQKAINDNIKKAKGEQRILVDNQIINPLVLSTAVAKYSGLLNASAYYPAWMQKKELAESKEFSNISYATVPFSEISDSLIKISDDEINAYVKKNKDLFKQEAGRMITYVAFSQLPNREDSTRAKMAIEELRTPFATDTNAQAFVARNGSTIAFDDAYKTKAKFGSQNIDSIVSAPAGTVTGPYIEGSSYVLAKVLGTKQMPDSARTRHILLQTYDPQAQTAKMPDTTAKKLADSILAAIKSGADFNALVTKYSDDGGSKTTGGVYENFSYEKMVPEFSDFSFNQPVGSKGIVKTVYGYHIIEVLGHKDPKPAYKIAFMGKEILAGDVTVNQASLQATKASSEKDGKALVAFAAKNGIGPIEVPTLIKENDFSVGSLQDARALIRWVFDAKQGEVSEVFNIGDQFVVATVNKIYKEGLQDAENARPGAEVILRKQKKTEMIIKKIGTNPTVESVAAAYNRQVLQAGADSSITMSTQIINGLGIEPKVIGASFNKDYQAKASPAFAGTNGVFVIKINSIQRKPDDAPEVVTQQAATRLGALRNQTNAWYEGLKKLADIEDKRKDYF